MSATRHDGASFFWVPWLDRDNRTLVEASRPDHRLCPVEAKGHLVTVDRRGVLG